MLPVAFGEATKTVPVVQDGLKRYRFAVKWGAETDTDDAEGRVVAESEMRPDARRSPRVAAFRRRHPADAAHVFGDQDRRRTRL